jgi:hypothetical protein
MRKEHAGGHPYVLIGVDPPAQADHALAELRIEALEGQPGHPRLTDRERPRESGRRLELEQHLAAADDLGHPQVAAEVDLAAAVCREHVAAALDPDQVVGAVATDPLVADGVGGALGSGRLGPGGRRHREQHRETDDGARNAAPTAWYPRHTNGDCPLSLVLETKPIAARLSTNGS